MRRRRFVFTALAAAALAAGVAGCGDQGGEVGTGDLDSLSQAVAALKQASTGRIAGEYRFMEERISPTRFREVGPEGLEPGGEDEGSPEAGTITTTVRAELDGAFDLAASRSSIAVEIVEADTTGDLPGSMSRPPAVGERYEAVRDGDDRYTRETGVEGRSDHWRRYAADPFDSLLMAMFFGMDADGITEPGQLLRQLEHAAVELSETGSGEVRGDPVSTYRVTLSVASLQELAVDDALARGPAPSYFSEEEFRAEIDALRDIKIVAEVGIDADGRIRMVAADLDLGQLQRRFDEARERTTGTTNFRSSMMDDSQVSYRIEFYDLGEPVTIEVPDGSEVDDGYGRFEEVGEPVDCREVDGAYECFEPVGEAVESNRSPGTTTAGGPRG